jgi:hypothetical protein
MLVNFAFPAIYGLELYGSFIQANILVFVFQKLADIVSEPLISHLDKRFIFATSLVFSSIIMGLFIVTNFLISIGDPQLLGVMLLSSCCLLSMYALEQQLRIVIYLISFLGVFFILLALQLLASWSLNIVDILIWTNGVPCIFAVIGLLTSGSKLPSSKNTMSTMVGVLSLLPRMVSVTFVFNLLTNILPYILSKTLSLGDLGLFRVATSVIQSATSMFPVSAKAIFVAFIRGVKAEELCKALMLSSLLYFSVLGFFAYVGSWLFPNLSKYLTLIASLPVLYWAVVLERYQLAIGLRRRVIVANLIIGLLIICATIFVGDLSQAMIMYAIGFSGYVLILYINSQLCIDYRIIIFVTILSPIIIWLEDLSSFIPIFFMAALTILSIFLVRLNWANIHNLKQLK